jgi:hypothetical protein
MPYSGPGKRHTIPAATKAVKHGKPSIENGIPGIAFKVAQLGAFVDPTVAAATLIAVGEAFEIDPHGIHEVERSGTLATGDIGAAAVADIYIKVADNSLGLAADALTASKLNAGWQKFGKVVERDASRTPQVLRVDCDLRDVMVGDAV